MKKEAIRYYQRKDFVKKLCMSSLEKSVYRIKILKRYMSTQTQNFLKVGCGTERLQTIHPNYVGIDVSVPALNELNGKGIQASVERLPFKSESIDFICSFDTFEHVFDVKAALFEIDCILTPNGIVVFVRVGIWRSTAT